LASRKLVRLVHPKHYSEEQHRFKSPAFKDTDGTGISVVDESCVEALPALLCEHIQKYYKSSISGEPPVFWRFEYSDEFVQIVHDDDDEDPCHYNIRGLSASSARQMVIKLAVDKFEICGADGIRIVTLEDIRKQTGFVPS
jgi:hypothetical protein